VLRTGLCRELGIEYPIFSVGFARMAGPELAAAVSNAGAGGVLGGTGIPAPYLSERIQRVRTLTGKPFGVNVILAIMRGHEIDICLDHKVPFLVLFWGDPAPYVRPAHERGMKVFVQVGSINEGTAAASAGVDAIIAQGMEAGGHVKSITALSSIVPAIAEAVKPIPVIASGGVADGRGLVAALSLGAQAVSMGTRFIASTEAYMHERYKQRVVQSSGEDTVYSELFDVGWPGAPHRVLRNHIVREWEAAGRPPSGQRPGEGGIIGTATRLDGTVVEIRKYATMNPTPDFTGDIDQAPLWAGESCGLVNEIKPAGQIVQDIMRQAEDIAAGIQGWRAAP
jgi:NAD(P)H-dependent flavin oxidoreductase YrpB (nitropropane dioxygenase family)